MSRVRTYVVGRDRACDVRLEDPSVSRRHAEVVRASGGGLFVTDCATTNLTYVMDGRRWRAIRQELVEPAGRLRFGDCEMTVERLDALCPRGEVFPGGGGDAGSAGAGAGTRGDDTPDPTHGMERIPDTGELIEKEPPPRQRRWRRE